MKKNDRILGVIWFILGSAIAVEALRLGMGDVRRPGAGFMAFLIGTSLGVSGLLLTLWATLKGKGGSKLFAGQNWKNVTITLLALVLYIFVMEPLGFFLSTFLLLFVLFKITAPNKWFSPLVTSVMVVFSCYLIFVVWLKIPLPKGVLPMG